MEPGTGKAVPLRHYKRDVARRSPGKPDAYIYTFSADLIQLVTLMRKAADSVEACTWSSGYSVVVPTDDLRAVTVKVGELAQEFVRALEAANQITLKEVGGR